MEQFGIGISAFVNLLVARRQNVGKPDTSGYVADYVDKFMHGRSRSRQALKATHP